MTCIAAYTLDGVTAIGCDSEAASDYRTRLSTKLYVVGAMTVGLTGSTTWNRFLRQCRATTPEELVDAWAEWARARGHGATTDGVWHLDGAGLVATPGWIAEVYPTGSVEEPIEGYAAIGSGAEVAIGVLHVARRQRWAPEDAVRLAVEAAISHARGCGGWPVVHVLTQEQA